MKISSILAFMFVFGLMATAGVYLFNTWAADYGTGTESDISESYDKLNDLYKETNSTYQQIELASGGTDTGNFLTNLAAIWRAVKLLGKTFSFGVEISNSAADDLNLPAEIRWTILGLLLISIVTIIITIAARTKLES